MFYTILLFWFQHGEGYGGNESSSSNSKFKNVGNSEETIHLHNENSYYHQDQMLNDYRVHNIVTYANLETTTTIGDKIQNVEEPNLDTNFFYEMLDTANQPIYDGGRERSLNCPYHL